MEKLHVYLISSICLVFSSIDKYTTRFLLYLKRNDSQTLKSSSCHKLFLQYISFKSMLFIICDKWKTLFFIRVYHYSLFFSTTMLLCVLKQVSQKSTYFNSINIHNYITMLIAKVQKDLPCIICVKLSYQILFFDKVFYTLHFLSSLKMNLLKN